MSDTGPTLAELHELVRTKLHGGVGSTEARQSHSRLARDMWGKIPAEDIRDGILGIVKLRERGVIDGWQANFGLRQALRWHHDGRQLWDAAIDEERHAQANYRTPTPIARGETMHRVGTLLGHVG